MLEKIILYVQHLRNPEPIVQMKKSYMDKSCLVEEVFRREGLETVVNDKSKVLVIVDDAEISKDLLKENYYVIGYCHTHNGNQEFNNTRYIIEDIEEIEHTYFEEVYGIYSGSGRIMITTNRCILREITLEDVPRLYEIYQREEVTQYVEPLYDKMEDEIEYTKKYIENMYGFYGYGIWIVQEKETGLIIGRAGLEANGDKGGVDMGFLLIKEKQGMGIGYELCCAMMDYTREKQFCNIITCLVQLENTPSINLCKKLGFQYKGTEEMLDKYFQKYQYDTSVIV